MEGDCAGQADKHCQQHLQVAKESAMNLLAWHVVTKRRSRRVTRKLPHPPTRATQAQRVIPRSDPQDFNSDQWEAQKAIVSNTKGGLMIDKIKVDTSEAQNMENIEEGSEQS